jgi:hypothetical protein
MTTRAMRSTVGGGWQHKAERSLVALGRPTVGIGVVISNGVLITTARTALKAGTGDDPSQLTIQVMASDDHRWRGARVGILNCDIATDLALLGAAPWVEPEGLDTLTDLLRERHAVGAVDLDVSDAVTLSIPTESGVWARLPGTVTSELDISITAVPINEDASVVVAAHWVGLPAFTDARLAGFLIHDATGHIMVRRVDQLIRLGARTTADRLEKSPQAPKRLQPTHTSARSSHLCTGMTAETAATHDFMTIAEAAAEARVSAKRFRSLMATGVLREGQHYTRPAGLRPRIIREELMRWLRGHLPSAPAPSSRPSHGRSRLNPALIRPARKPSRE